MVISHNPIVKTVKFYQIIYHRFRYFIHQ